MITPNQEILTMKEYLFIFFGLCGMMIGRFLSWIMPKTANIFWAGVKSFMRDIYNQNNEAVLKEIKLLRMEVKTYRDKKHVLEAENLEMKEALTGDDSERLELVRKLYKEKQKNYKDDTE